MPLKILYILFVSFSCHVMAWSETAKLNPEKFTKYRYLSGLMQKGIQFALSDQFDSTHYYFEKAYSMALAKKLDELIPLILVSHSRIFAMQNNYEKSFDKLNLAEPYFIQDSTRIYAGDYYEFRAQYYMKLNRDDEAIKALEKAERIRQITEPGKNWRTYNGLARLYNRKKMHEKAEFYLQKAEKLAKYQNTNRMLTDIQNELKFDEKDGTIAILNKENKKNKTRSGKNKIQKSVAWTCAFFLCIAFRFFVHYFAAEK